MKKYLSIIIIFLMSYNPVGAQSLQTSPNQTTPTTVALRQREVDVCDPNFRGEPITFSVTTQLTLEALVDQIYRRFGVNFLMGDGIKNLPIDIRSGSLPWKTMLDAQLYLSGVSAKCVNSNTLLLVKNDKRKDLDIDQVNSAELHTEFIKLKYLQPTTSQTRDIAGRSDGNQGGGQGCQGNQGGGGQSGGSGGGNNNQACGNFEKLKYEIENILGLHDSKSTLVPTASVENNEGGSVTYNNAKKVESRGAVAVIPGRNIFVIRGTAEQLKLIKQFIELADRPPFQVVIKGLVYTANENRIRDIGVQASAIIGTGNLNTLGGVTSQPNIPAEDTTDQTQQIPPGRPNPGGVRTLGNGFQVPTGGNTIFGFSALVGTAQFSVQATALQQNGVISVKSRPFAIVLDGEATNLDVGRQIPILTLGQIAGESGSLEIIKASNILAVTPHVIDDDSGNPVAVSLEIQLESNEVDTSVISQGIPSVARRSIQSKLILNQDKTVILGGFTIDSITNSITKTPGLGDIPLLGELFKRRVRTVDVNRLYFALSVEVVPYGQVIEPVDVPGATTEIPGVSKPVLKSEDKLENMKKKDQ